MGSALAIAGGATLRWAHAVRGGLPPHPDRYQPRQRRVRLHARRRHEGPSERARRSALTAASIDRSTPPPPVPRAPLSHAVSPSRLPSPSSSERAGPVRVTQAGVRPEWSTPPASRASRRKGDDPPFSSAAPAALVTGGGRGLLLHGRSVPVRRPRRPRRVFLRFAATGGVRHTTAAATIDDATATAPPPVAPARQAPSQSTTRDAHGRRGGKRTLPVVSGETFGGGRSRRYARRRAQRVLAAADATMAMPADHSRARRSRLRRRRSPRTPRGVTYDKVAGV